MDFKRVPEDRKVPLVATKFRGKAASWWLQTKTARARAGKESVRTWAKLEKLLRKSFLPYNFDRTMFTRLQNLRQGSRTVDDYAEEFTLLLTRNEVLDSDVQLVSRFIGGLRPQIQSAMSQFDPLTIAEAHRRVVAFEQQFKSSTQGWNSSKQVTKGSKRKRLGRTQQPAKLLQLDKMQELKSCVVLPDQPQLGVTLVGRLATVSTLAQRQLNGVFWQMMKLSGTRTERKVLRMIYLSWKRRAMQVIMAPYSCCAEFALHL